MISTPVNLKNKLYEVNFDNKDILFEYDGMPLVYSLDIDKYTKAVFYFCNEEKDHLKYLAAFSDVDNYKMFCSNQITINDFFSNSAACLVSIGYLDNILNIAADINASEFLPKEELYLYP